MEIKAEGKLYGRKVKVIATKNEKGKYVFEFPENGGLHPDVLRSKIQFEMEQQYIVGGTYIPPVESDVNVLSVLTDYFFDDQPQIEAKDIEPMPWQEGVIY